MIYSIRNCIWGNQYGNRTGDVLIDELVAPHDPTSQTSCGVSTEIGTVVSIPGDAPLWRTVDSDPALLLVLWPAIAAVIGARAILRTVREARQ